MSPMPAAGLALFSGAMIAAAGSDLARRRIPNRLTGALALGALVFALPQDPGGWASRGLAVLLVAALCLAAYARSALGGGDLKLLVAAAAWMPLASLPVFGLALALAGGLQVLVTLARRLVVSGGAGALRGRMPYGVSIATAGLVWAAAQGAGCATC